jgi:hypothetical protein
MGMKLGLPLQGENRVCVSEQDAEENIWTKERGRTGCDEDYIL